MIILRNPQIAELIEAGCAFKSHNMLSPVRVKTTIINTAARVVSSLFDTSLQGNSLQWFFLIAQVAAGLWL